MPAAADSPLLEAYSFYCGLTEIATHLHFGSKGSEAEAFDTEPNLGGNLLYAGELDVQGCARIVAGNVAGCATLAATADTAALKQAIFEGTIDFVVTSLDEALRILKNEIRKQATVAVCVGLAPADIEREMLERGVLPDLVAAGSVEDRRGQQAGFKAREVRCSRQDESKTLLEWRVASVRWMSKLDAIALEYLRSDVRARRWIRLAPRYCGRAAQGQRLVDCNPEVAARIVDGFGCAVRDGVIGTEVLGRLRIGGESKSFRLLPA